MIDFDEIDEIADDLKVELTEERLKYLDVLRARNLACIVSGIPCSGLEKDNPKALCARLLIMTYLVDKGLADNEVTKACGIPKKDWVLHWDRYVRLKSRSKGFRDIEDSFLKKISLCCAKI